MKTYPHSAAKDFSRFTCVLGTAWSLLLGGPPSAQADSLKERLDAKRAEFLKAVPADKAQSYQAGIESVAPAASTIVR